MRSLDTNVLLYATNSDCREHGAARGLVERALAEPREWIVADQVYFELYRLVRNPAVLESPLSASEAADLVQWYRSRSGWSHCAWEPQMMQSLSSQWRRTEFAARNTFDLVLAVTLHRNGVTEFYTRNETDFSSLNLFRVVDPIGSA